MSLGVVVAAVSGLVYWVAQQIWARALWVDEAAVALVVKRAWGDLNTIVIESGHPLLYAYAMKLWTSVWGGGVVGLRSFSLVWAGLLVPLMFWAGRDLAGRRVGQLAAVFTATNYFLIWYAGQVKVYTMAASLLVAAWLGLRWWWREQTAGNNVPAGVYMACTLAALYSHPWSGLVYGVHLAYSIYCGWQRGAWKPVVYVHGVIGLGALPQIYAYMKQAQLGASAWIEAPPLDFLWISLGHMSTGLGWAYLGAVLLTLGVIGYRVYMQGRKWPVVTPAVGWVMACLCIPLGAAWLGSYWRPMYVVGRYEMIVLPFFILLLAWWVGQLRWRGMAVVSLIVFGWLTQAEVQADRQEVDSYVSSDATVVAQVKEATQEGDEWVALNLAWATVQYYAAFDEGTRRVNPFPASMSNHPGWRRPPSQAKYQDYKQEAERLVDKFADEGTKRVWLFLSEEHPAQVALLVQMSEEGWRQVEVVVPQAPHAPTWLGAVVLLVK